MGKNKHSICHCDYCVEGREKRQEYAHGGIIEDYDDLLPYRKAPRKRSRRGKACKKSKTGEPCDFTISKVIGTKWEQDRNGKRYPSPDTIMTCSRCGRYGWKTYSWPWNF